MSDFSLPTVTSAYSTYPQEIRDARESVAKWFDGTTDSNLASGFKRWSAANRRFEEYDGSAWGELLPMATSAQAYQIRAQVANSADTVAGANVTGSVPNADLAANATNLGGVAAAQYVQTTDSRMTDSRQCNNSFDSASTARSNLSVYSQIEVNNALGYKADVASPTFTGNPAAPTLSQTNDSTGLATTYFANRSFYFGAPIALAPYVQSGWTDSGSFAIPVYQRGSIVAAHIFIYATCISGASASAYSISSGALSTLCSNQGYTVYFTTGISNMIIPSSTTMNIGYTSSPTMAMTAAGQCFVFARSVL